MPGATAIYRFLRFVAPVLGTLEGTGPGRENCGTDARPESQCDKTGHGDLRERQLSRRQNGDHAVKSDGDRMFSLELIDDNGTRTDTGAVLKLAVQPFISAAYTEKTMQASKPALKLKGKTF